jgi:hypothetical protein
MKPWPQRGVAPSPSLAAPLVSCARPSREGLTERYAAPSPVCSSRPMCSSRFMCSSRSWLISPSAPPFSGVRSADRPPGMGDLEARRVIGRIVVPRLGPTSATASGGMLVRCRTGPCRRAPARTASVRRDGVGRIVIAWGRRARSRGVPRSARAALHSAGGCVRDAPTRSRVLGRTPSHRGRTRPAQPHVLVDRGRGRPPELRVTTRSA